MGHSGTGYCKTLLGVGVQITDLKSRISKDEQLSSAYFYKYIV